MSEFCEKMNGKRRAKENRQRTDEHKRRAEENRQGIPLGKRLARWRRHLTGEKVMGSMLAVLLALLFTTGGLALAIGSIFQMVESSRTGRWTPVKATILEIEKGSRPGSIPTILYTYRFGGKDYTNHKISLGLPMLVSYSRFSAGKVVDAWIDPLNPRKSILVQVSLSEGKMIYAVLAGMAAFMMGLLSAYAAWQYLFTKKFWELSRWTQKPSFPNMH